MIEIERRALLNETEYKRVKAYLDENAKFLGKRKFVSYLFNDPSYLRM